jgi:sterol desaturase/sphingolipid hydroxylase (fatty acid hydroxylase superfamily)
MILWLVAGFAAAHVLESAWHRFVAHGKRPDPTRTNHLEHHRLAALPVPVWAELRQHGPRGLAILLVVSVALAFLVGVARAAPLAIGLTLGMVAVNFEHARMHARAPRGRWERWMWRFHWHHHAADARVNYGLTNPLLDYALGTVVAPREVVLHPKLAPAWLLAEGGAYAGIRVRDEDRAAL